MLSSTCTSITCIVSNISHIPLETVCTCSSIIKAYEVIEMYKYFQRENLQIGLNEFLIRATSTVLEPLRVLLRTCWYSKRTCIENLGYSTRVQGKILIIVLQRTVLPVHSIFLFLIDTTVPVVLEY